MSGRSSPVPRTGLSDMLRIKHCCTHGCMYAGRTQSAAHQKSVHDILLGSYWRSAWFLGPLRNIAGRLADVTRPVFLIPHHAYFNMRQASRPLPRLRRQHPLPSRGQKETGNDAQSNPPRLILRLNKDALFAKPDAHEAEVCCTSQHSITIFGGTRRRRKSQTGAWPHCN